MTTLELNIFDTITGLPVHPLVVHFAVVLLPLAALALVILVIVPRWADRFGWVTLAALAVAWFVQHRRSAKAGRGRTTGTIVAGVAAAVLALGVTGLTVAVGHTGAQAAWGDVGVRGRPR